MRKILQFILCVASFACPAQSKEDVEKVVLDYVEGFYYGDSMKIHNSISPTVIKHGYYRAKNKTSYEWEAMTYKECIDYAVDVKKKGVSPYVSKFPKKIEVFDVLDITASAKLTAWWGTDYILLSKINNKWLITHVLWQSSPLNVSTK